MSDEKIFVLSNALVNNNLLKELDLSGSNSSLMGDGITGAGWAAFSTVLRDPNTALEKLNLTSNIITDHIFTSFAEALADNNKLKELAIGGDKHMSAGDSATIEGWVAFSSILQNPNSALEKLSLIGNVINDPVLISFANSLINNRGLRELELDLSFDINSRRRNNITIDGYAVLINTLLNTSSILGTFDSNHTHRRLGHLSDEDDMTEVWYLPIDLTSLLRLNAENFESKARRTKIIKTHFSEREVSIQPFMDMELTVLPTAIFWIVRGEYVDEYATERRVSRNELSLLYQLIRAVLTLFEH